MSSKRTAKENEREKTIRMMKIQKKKKKNGDEPEEEMDSTGKNGTNYAL